MATDTHGVSVETGGRVATIRLDGPTPGNLLSVAAMTAVLDAARADPFWGVPARWLTVAWAGNTALVLLFLQLDLLIRLMKG